MDYKDSLNVLLKELLPLISMTVVIITLRIIWPPVESRVLLVGQLAICALCGIIPFGLLGLHNGVIYKVFGKDTVKNILRKLHLAK